MEKSQINDKFTVFYQKVNDFSRKRFGQYGLKGASIVIFSAGNCTIQPTKEGIFRYLVPDLQPFPVKDAFGNWLSGHFILEIPEPIT